ncbi:hypothetical protein [Halorussus amylolyticus]|uniref:hypothetical protein n=1 Tax=Halorussus amylolyticus TaxID=1126242 RepID=UPI001050D713|nr:hypothetical protein [Halorussus amylolyticus]
MSLRISLRTHIVISFFAALLGGYVASKRDDRDRQYKKNLYGKIASMAGTMVGYRLAKRSRDE